MATWPATLPAVIADSYQEIMANNAIRTKMDVGLAKVRKRSTAAPVQFQMAYNMTSAQVTTLETFFNTTINDGVDQFTMANPRTAVSETWRITAPPQVTIVSSPLYRVIITMEKLP
jgi:3-isopropylmalate dehydratase small subunit